ATRQYAVFRIEIKLDGASEREIRRLGGLGKRVLPAITRAARYGAEQLASKIAEQELGPDGALKVVTGKLRASLRGRVLSTGATVVAAVGVTKGPATKYAAIHERGGVIRPKNAKALAIPLPAARGPGGKPRYPGGPREAARKHPNMFMLKQKGKPPLLCYAKRVRGKAGGKVSELVPLFVLKKSVKVPARHWLSGGVRKHRDTFVVAIQQERTALLKG
ncbi:MAG: hypothetical protein KAV82_15190, partial [Phycisphaerae bacterium]|nr:hypothetical protein [Phycisphaerae bacterium]